MADGAADPAAGVGLDALKARVAASPDFQAANATARLRRGNKVDDAYMNLINKSITPELDKLGVTLDQLNAMHQLVDLEAQTVVGHVLKTVFAAIFKSSPTGSAEKADLARSALASLYNSDGRFAGYKCKLNEHQALKEYLQGAHSQQTKKGGGVAPPTVLSYSQYAEGLLGGGIAAAREVR